LGDQGDRGLIVAVPPPARYPKGWVDSDGMDRPGELCAVRCRAGSRLGVWSWFGV
jgi:hypothetical protein